MPVIVIVILEGAAMTGAPCKPTWLITKRVRLRRKGTQGIIAYYNAVGITAELGSGRSILQVIFAVVFGHMRPFHKRVEKSIVEIFAKTLPAITPGLQQVHFFSCADGLKGCPV